MLLERRHDDRGATRDGELHHVLRHRLLHGEVPEQREGRLLQRGEPRVRGGRRQHLLHEAGVARLLLRQRRGAEVVEAAQGVLQHEGILEVLHQEVGELVQASAFHDALAGAQLRGRQVHDQRAGRALHDDVLLVVDHPFEHVVGQADLLQVDGTYVVDGKGGQEREQHGHEARALVEAVRPIDPMLGQSHEAPRLSAQLHLQVQLGASRDVHGEVQQRAAQLFEQRQMFVVLLHQLDELMEHASVAHLGAQLDRKLRLGPFAVEQRTRHDARGAHERVHGQEAVEALHDGRMGVDLHETRQCPRCAEDDLQRVQNVIGQLEVLARQVEGHAKRLDATDLHHLVCDRDCVLREHAQRMAGLQAGAALARVVRQHADHRRHHAHLEDLALLAAAARSQVADDAAALLVQRRVVLLPLRAEQPQHALQAAFSEERDLVGAREGHVPEEAQALQLHLPVPRAVQLLHDSAHAAKLPDEALHILILGEVAQRCDVGSD
mmetsp:Transcript_62855/g.161799  ORF Transcript_62855/g.161799 Transcript_62855/m.161799 type:complete len:494 (+) Transcript_62855:664-2145(+)